MDGTSTTVSFLPASRYLQTLTWTFPAIAPLMQSLPSCCQSSSRFSHNRTLWHPIFPFHVACAATHDSTRMEHHVGCFIPSIIYLIFPVTSLPGVDLSLSRFQRFFILVSTFNVSSVTKALDGVFETWHSFRHSPDQGCCCRPFSMVIHLDDWRKHLYASFLSVITRITSQRIQCGTRCYQITRCAPF